MSGTHARLMPSAMERTVPCPGSVRLSEPFLDQPDTEDTLNGEAAHWAALKLARDGELPEVAPNGVEITEDMRAGAALYTATLLDRQPNVKYYEEWVPIKRIHAECGGTPDYADYTVGMGALRIVDYKYGHYYVEAFENFQLLSYAVGLIEKMKLSEQYLHLELVIVQPRWYGREGKVRTWRVDAIELRALVNVVANACDEALGDNPRTKTGEHCEFCLGRAVCPTLHRSAMRIVDMTGGIDPMLSTPEQFGSEHKLLREARALIDARLTGIGQQAESLLKQGKRVPYVKLEATQGNLKWTKPPSEVLMLGAMLEKSLAKPPTLITPTQAIELGIDEAVILGYAARPTSGLKLTADDPLKSRKVFNK